MINNRIKQYGRQRLEGRSLAVLGFPLAMVTTANELQKIMEATDGTTE
jgi:hypothetical protein